MNPNGKTKNSNITYLDFEKRFTSTPFQYDFNAFKFPKLSEPEKKPTKKTDSLIAAIIRRSIDDISLVLRYPHFATQPLSATEEKYMEAFKEFTHNPFLLAVKLQCITNIEVGNPTSSSRADVVAYLFKRRELVHEYLRETGQLQAEAIRAVVNSEVEAIQFAEEAENPAPLSTILLSIHSS